MTSMRQGKRAAYCQAGYQGWPTFPRLWEMWGPELLHYQMRERRNVGHQEDQNPHETR
jgi:hypothetical protein